MSNKVSPFQIVIDLAQKAGGTLRVDNPDLMSALGTDRKAGGTHYRLATYIGDVRRKTTMVVEPVKSGRAVVAYHFPSLANGAPAPVVSPEAPRAPKVVKVKEPAAVPQAPQVAAAIDNTANLSFAVTKSTSAQETAARLADLVSDASLLATIPARSTSFVPFGEFESIRKVIRSRTFCPVFITGHSGNGKTFQIEQACALETREYIRVNITAETDEDDLIGGFRLKDGETVFEVGPVVIAMLRGAVLLLDEVDLAGPKVMCLQPVLEGQALTIKKLGISISPTTGFTVFATANTKGRGSEDGKYVGTNMLNEAFLERFNFTVEQAYPAVAVEKKILAKTFAAMGGVAGDSEFAFFELLAKWADAIRVTFEAEGIDDLISTRRLVHIVRTYHIFGDRQKALTLCLNRFDRSVKEKFLDFYAALDPSTSPAPAPTPVADGPVADGPVSF